MITGDVDFWIPSVETDENMLRTNLSMLPMIICAHYECMGCWNLRGEKACTPTVAHECLTQNLFLFLLIVHG